MSAEVSEVEHVVAAFAAAWNQHDMDAFAGLFAADAEFVNVVGMWWKGRAEIKAAHEFTHRTLFRHSRLAVAEVSVRFPDPTLAIARCRWVLEGHVDPAGASLPARHGVLLNLVHRQAGKWLIIDSQNTDIVEGVASRPQQA